MMSDADIRLNVETELAWDPGISSKSILAKAEKGAGTLGGGLPEHFNCHRGEEVISPSCDATRKPCLDPWVRDAQTRDGVAYRIRPIQDNDEARELAFIEALSPDTLYNRMLCGFHLPTPAQLHRWVHVDHRLNMAFVAVLDEPQGERFAGVVRYCTDGDQRCEYAIAIADEWQGRGIGTALSQVLIDYARCCGIREMHALILSTNRRMIDLAQSLGMHIKLDVREPRLVDASMPTT